MLDFGLAIKFVAIGAAALFGVFAAFGDTHENGRLTRIGYIAIVGVIVSSGIAAISQYFDARQEASQLKDDIAWQRIALNDIKRGLFQIPEWNITVYATYSADSSDDLRSFSKQLDKVIESHPPQWRGRTNAQVQVDSTSYISYSLQKDGGVDTMFVILSHESPLLRYAEQELTSFHLYVGEIAKLESTNGSCDERTADTIFYLTTIGAGEGDSHTVYKPKDRTIEVVGYYEPAHISYESRLLTLQDLRKRMLLLVPAARIGTSRLLSVEKLVLDFTNKSAPTNWGLNHVYRNLHLSPICNEISASAEIGNQDFPVVGSD
ncbi:MAG: hypothetical protein JO261_03530 [Alphaproteobacteria bacterium]|nr:hypothetical protein [Alphaproteobacteria bacterium]MBV9692750.1 hypothetical protein [Alphaproteobacteria bacterium]